MKYRHVTFFKEDPLTEQHRVVWNTYNLISAIAAAVLAVAVVLVLFFRVATVQGHSMEPTLTDGDHLLVSSVSAHYNRGDIVVIGYPSDTTLVKRVVAVSGDTIDFDFSAGKVFLNGKELQEDYLKEATHRWFSDGPTYPLTIPAGYVFVMGDNRNDSLDSRSGEIGLVSVQSILGKEVYPF